MKKILALILLVCLSLSLGACTKKENKEASSDAPSSVQEETAVTDKGADEKPGTGTDDSVSEPMDIKLLPADEQTTAFFSSLPKELVYSSGAGGWATVLSINPNGTFTGEYHDSEMGVTGEGFPNGTVYRSSFSGKFSTPLPLDDYTYISFIEKIDIKTTVGEIKYEDGVKYENVAPCGLENAKEVVFYLPGAPKNTLSDEFLSWVTPHYEVKDALPDGVYGMFSFNDQTGFVGKK